MSAIDVTAVVLNFRTPQKTLDCLGSLAANDVRRIVLVENSEDGGTAIRVMRGGLAHLSAEGISIVVIDEGRNLGFAAGVNRALQLIRANDWRHALLLNSDARLQPDALPRLVQALHRGAGMAAPTIVDESGVAQAIEHGYYQKYLALLLARRWPGCTQFFSGACLLLSKEIVGDALFDEDFFFYGEDVALSACLERRGLACVSVEDAKVIHEVSGSARNGSLFYEYHINRGHWLTATKLARNPLEQYLFVAARCLTLPLRALARSIRLRSLVAWQGLFAATADVLRGRCRSHTPPP